MNYFCPRCHGEKFVTVRLRQEGKDYVCTQDPKHIFTIDAAGFPRRKK